MRDTHPSAFAILERCHAELEECFLLHQEALLAADFPLAARYLALYRTGLMLHISQEDELLLPRYAEVEAHYRWPLRVYSGEHRKLEFHLQRCILDFARVCQAPTRRGVLALLERHKTLKHLAEHHHQREEESLFPALEALISEAERETLLAHCQERWQGLLLSRPRLQARLLRRLGPG